MKIKNKYYTWIWAKEDSSEEYSYLVPIYNRPSNVLGAYVNLELYHPVGVSREFWSVEEAPEIGDSQFQYAYKKPPKKYLIEAQRELIAGVFVNT